MPVALVLFDKLLFQLELLTVGINGETGVLTVGQRSVYLVHRSSRALSAGLSVVSAISIGATTISVKKQG